MSIIGDLFFMLRGDSKQLEVDVKKAGDKAGESFGAKLSASLKKSWSGQDIGKGLVQGFGMAGGLGAATLLSGAVSKVTDFIGDSISASRDLTESVSKSRVVFGGFSKDIEAFGDTAAQSMGISKQAAVEAAASFGNLFVGLDLGQDKAAEMSKGIVKLAGDLASFNNMDPGEVLDKLRAGLSGEAEPLRRVGVFLTEAKVKAKAMTMGLTDAHGELSEGAKVLARYALILEETGTAQGDFARTSDGLANTQRRAAAELIDQQAKLGAAFEPVALQVTKWQIDFLEGLDLVSTGLGDFQRDSRQFADSFTPWDTESERAAKAVAVNVEKAAEAVRDATGSSGAAFRESEKNIGGAGTGIESSIAGIIAKSKTMASTIKNGVDNIKTWVAGLRSTLAAEAIKMISGYYDPIIAQQELLVAKDEAATAQREMLATRAGTVERRQANLTLANSRLALDQTRANLLAAGTLSKNEQKIWLSELQAKYKTATGDARAKIGALIAKIKELQRTETPGIKIAVQVNDLGSNRRGGYATGGSPPVGVASWVGERGRELIVPKTPSIVFPHAASEAIAAGGMGNTTNIAVQLPPKARLDPFEVATQLRRMADMKVLTP